MTYLKEVQTAYAAAEAHAEFLREKRDLAIADHYARTQDSYQSIGEICGISHTKVRRIVMRNVDQSVYLPPAPYIDPIGQRENPYDVA